MRPRTRTAALAVLATLAVAPVATAENERFEFIQPHMGTLWRVVLVADDASTAQRASDAVFARVFRDAKL